MFSCIASGVKLLLFDTAKFKRLVMQFKSLDTLHYKKKYIAQGCQK